jgi:hypothetical protein
MSQASANGAPQLCTIDDAAGFRAARHRKALVQRLDERGYFQPSVAWKQCQWQAIRHHDSAAQRDGRAASGPRLAALGSRLPAALPSA